MNKVCIILLSQAPSACLVSFALRRATTTTTHKSPVSQNACRFSFPTYFSCGLWWSEDIIGALWRCVVIVFLHPRHSSAAWRHIRAITSWCVQYASLYWWRCTPNNNNNNNKHINKTAAARPAQTNKLNQHSQPAAAAAAAQPMVVVFCLFRYVVVEVVFFFLVGWCPCCELSWVLCV